MQNDVFMTQLAGRVILEASQGSLFGDMSNYLGASYRKPSDSMFGHWNGHPGTKESQWGETLVKRSPDLR